MARIRLVKNDRHAGNEPHYLLQVSQVAVGHAVREHDNFTTPEEENPL